MTELTAVSGLKMRLEAPDLSFLASLLFLGLPHAYMPLIGRLSHVISA